VKIGPTAIPALWREQYQGLSGFDAGEMMDILALEAKLFYNNAFGFRDLALEEMQNYRKSIFVGRARGMVRDLHGDFTPMPAGIRAQLLDKNTGKLVTDFLVEHRGNTTHILNAVSPAFTGSFAFAKHVVEGMGGS
jgi:L-2-hydroxyglutarate oxidase LhgO